MAQTNIKVKVTGKDGNAFAILGAVSGALKRGGKPELAKEFMSKAMKGDYYHLLATAGDYVEVS